MAENKEMLSVIVRALDSKKGINIEALQIENITVLTDYFVICTGTSNTHVKALADEVEYQMTKQLSIEPLHRDANDGGKWILLDYSGIMVHIFSEQYRDFYKLERLWADGVQVDISEFIKEEE